MPGDTTKPSAPSTVAASLERRMAFLNVEAAVEAAVAEERARCIADCERVARRVPAEAVDDADYAFRGAAGACVDEIRARGVAKPRTGSESPSASDEGAKS